MAYANKIIIPEATRDAICHAYRHGLTLQTICRQWAVTESYARSIIRRTNVKKKFTHTTPAQRAEILKAYLGGMRRGDIAKRWNVPLAYPAKLASRAKDERRK